MKKYIPLILVLFVAVFLNAQLPDLSIWNNIRNSSYTAEDSLHIRCETIDFPGLNTELFYFDGLEWQAREMNPIHGLTYEGVIPAVYGGAQSCRFRTESDTMVAMMPALIMDDVFPPAAADLSLIASDPIGDCLAPDSENLDLTGNFFGYSASRFYSGISNVNGDFPLNSGGIFPESYYFYVTTIINPENVLTDSVGYAMIYCNIPILLPSGLYRIDGTELNLDTLVQIGNIESQVVEDNLILACDIATLTNDEFFGDWPSVSNALVVEMVTAEFSFPDVFQITDFSEFSLQFIDQYVIEPFTNILPEIIETDFLINPTGTTFWFTYFDENGHFPLLSSLNVNGDNFNFLPLSYDYSQPVIFETTIPVTAWTEATITISDNGFEYIEETILNDTGSEHDPLPQADIELINFPNPFNPSTEIRFQTSGQTSIANSIIEIYNLRGQLVKTFGSSSFSVSAANPHTISMVWDGTNDNHKPVSGGIYFARWQNGEKQLTRKMLLMK